METDVIDTPGGHCAGLASWTRSAHAAPEARKHAQASYDLAVRAEATGAGVSRWSAMPSRPFVAGLHGEPKIEAFYAAKLPARGFDDATRPPSLPKPRPRRPRALRSLSPRALSARRPPQGPA